jgi:hypothetical protein
MADVRRERLSRPDADAGKLADPALGVQEPDVRSLPPAQLAQIALVAPCIRGADRCAVRSCVAMVLAVVAAQ